MIGGLVTKANNVLGKRIPIDNDPELCIAVSQWCKILQNNIAKRDLGRFQNFFFPLLFLVD
jgi:hypothetical protein